MLINKDKLKECFPFSKFRKYQEEAICEILDIFLNGKKKYVILEAPTGIGKSVIAYTIGMYLKNELFDSVSLGQFKKLHGPPTIVCTKSRQLQKQYEESFANIAHLWSASHYMCEIDPMTPEHYYYDSPLCRQPNCKHIMDCKFLNARSRFKSSDIGILNYHYYWYSLMSNVYQPKFLVLDEAHNIEQVLCDMNTFIISKTHLKIIFEAVHLKLTTDIAYDTSEKLIEKIIDIKDPNNSHVYWFEQFNQILKTIRDNAKIEINRIKEKDLDKLDFFKQQVIDVSKIYHKCQGLTDKLDSFINKKSNWIIILKDEKKIGFKPLEIIDQANKLFDSSSRILFMSATICGYQQFCRELNIDIDTVIFKETKSVIPVKNRKTYILNVGRINFKNKKELMPKIVSNMDKFIKTLEERSGPVRGIVHSVSYENAKIVCELSELTDRMIIPQTNELLEVNNILKLYSNTIVVSPSILEGVDLKDDLSRFQIFPKIPFPFLGDAWIRGKMERDNVWYARQAVVKLVQGSGRSVRTENDWGVTLILDAGIMGLLKSYRNLFPEWYRESIEFLKED